MKNRRITQSGQTNFLDLVAPASSHGGRQELEEYLRRTGSILISDDKKQQILNGLVDEFENIFVKGDLTLLDMPIVSVVGTRTPSQEGAARTQAICKILVEASYVVMSGLAKGIDTVAHKSALQLNGKTIAVLGTPIHRIYPAENRTLGEEIAKRGLLVSASLPHEEVGRFLFPRRNRLMARLSIATVIVEAGPTSGVIHQAAECMRQKRKLILLNSLVENKSISWAEGFLRSGALVAHNGKQLLELLR